MLLISLIKANNHFFILIFILVAILKCDIGYFAASKKLEVGCFEYYSYANEGYCSFLTEDYESSVKYYKKAFSLREEGCNVCDYRNDHYLLAKALIKQNQIIESKKYLKNAILHGGLDWDSLVKDSISKITYNDKLIITSSSYDSLTKIRNKNIDLNLRIIIDSMVYKDRYYRLKAQNTLESKIDSIKNLQLIIDRENEAKLKAIIERDGFPGFSKIGTDDADILLMHSSWEYRKQVFPELLKEVDKGNINPDILGMMVDQEMILEGGRTQKYGYFIDFDEMYVKRFSPFKINDLDSINKFRSKIGAISLECSAIKNNAQFPISMEWEYRHKKM